MIRPGVVPISKARSVQMSASHGLNKNDKKFLRDLNHKLYVEGNPETVQNLTKEDVHNPNMRVTLQNLEGHKQLSKWQHN